MRKTIYEERHVAAPRIGMSIEWWVRRQGVWSTDMSGESSCIGHEYTHEFIVRAQSGEELKSFVYRSTKRGKGPNFAERLRIAMNWLYKFRRLNITTDYHPLCYGMNAAYPESNCPFVSIKGDMAQCRIQPSQYGFSMNFNGQRPLPVDRRCDVGLGTARQIGDHVLDHASGFTLYDYWRCAKRTDAHLIYGEG